MSRKARRIAILLLVVAGLQGCRGCRGCAQEENCEDCVARCVETQNVSPDVCKTTACATPCREQNQ